MRNLSFLILRCILWQLDSTNGTCHLDGSNKNVKDGLQDAYNKAENIYQERVNHVASARPEVLWFHCHSYSTETP